MPGSLPGVLGAVAFGGTKFLGYSLAVWGLKRFEPAISASAFKVAATRTGLGVVLGPLATYAVVFLISLVLIHPDAPPGYVSWSLDLPKIYALVFIIRVFVWALVLFLFTTRAPVSRNRFWVYAICGAIVSTLLDWPGYALALAAPGRIVFC